MKELLKKLDLVLDEEKRCLLEGKYTQLEEIVELKSKLSDSIVSQKSLPSKTAATYIAKKLERNEALLQSAQRGLKSAMTHLHEATDTHFQSYSKEGQRFSLSKIQKVQQNL